jgi:hypothetical protein
MYPLLPFRQDGTTGGEAGSRRREEEKESEEKSIRRMEAADVGGGCIALSPEPW